MSQSDDIKPCSVQSKISCILKTTVREMASLKRPGQSYSIEATNELSTEALSCNISEALPTEKLDGTCCHIRRHNGRSMLWARLDRKPNKGAEKRFKTFQRKHREWELHSNGMEPTFDWKFPDDLKVVPNEWIPADDITVDEVSKCPVPDKNGHVPGWLPVDNTSTQYCWHASVVDYDIGVAVTLRVDRSCSSESSERVFEICLIPLADLEGKTLELIGTNVNGNPYGLGSKSQPFHVLVEHGSIPVVDLPETLSYESLYGWFTGSKYSKVEGIVWHLSHGKMFKLHRHHLKLPWPISGAKDLTADSPLLSSTPVSFASKNPPFCEKKFSLKSMLATFSQCRGETFDTLADVLNNTVGK